MTKEKCPNCDISDQVVDKIDTLTDRILLFLQTQNATPVIEMAALANVIVVIGHSLEVDFNTPKLAEGEESLKPIKFDA